MQNALAMLQVGGWRLLLIIGSIFLLGLAMQFVDVAILYYCCAALKLNTTLGKAVACFGLASIISMLSMVPQGVGIYESSMTWILTRLGLPFSSALAVALLYRAVTYWFAMLPGLFVMSGKEEKHA